MVKPLAERIEEIYVDESDPDWGEMRDMDIAQAKQDYENDLAAERAELDAQWAVESGWVSSDVASNVIGSVDFESFQAGISPAEVAAAAEHVRAVRIGSTGLDWYQNAA